MLRKFCGDILPLQNNNLNFSEMRQTIVYPAFLIIQQDHCTYFQEKRWEQITTNKQKKN
jgi:hypothetical protein